MLAAIKLILNILIKVSMKRHKALTKVLRQFYSTTTLHGFKYLCSKYYPDRVGWLICCCASACCAGMLCAVVWARFLQVPALLTRRELRQQHEAVQMPTVAVCPTVGMVAHLFTKHLVINSTSANKLPSILNRVLRKKTISEDQQTILQDSLDRNNLSLADALLKVMPPCNKLIRNCRWLYVRKRCDEMFRVELTQWSACCVSRPTDMNANPSQYTSLEVSKRLILVMDCFTDSNIDGCEFSTKYDGEEWMEPTPLLRGIHYTGQLTFFSVLDSDPDKLVDETCVSNSDYSRSSCMLKCKERYCGCVDPLQTRPQDERNKLSLCNVKQLNCLRSIELVNYTCSCLPPCSKITTDVAMESSEIILTHTYDDIYAGVNDTTDTVLSLILRTRGSKLFVVTPTETWVTLLSSLGGVFNMFLGVGWFSALEILFVILVRLPIPVRRPTEITNSSDTTNHG